MLIYSTSVSVDGFIADREGEFGWTAPNEELFRFHLALVSELGGYLLGRRLYETMLVCGRRIRRCATTPSRSRTSSASCRPAAVSSASAGRRTTCASCAWRSTPPRP